MYNIWSFLLQTTSVSIVAIMLLFVKKLLADKLSPRWQYGVWILLMFRILVPVNLTRYVFPQIAIWTETLKAVCEKGLQSSYTYIYEPITLKNVIPMITEVPKSITDWLFVIYVAGIILCLLKYFISYISLRMLLSKGHTVSEDMEYKMLLLCEKYQLQPCRMIAVKGLTSAFICGVWKPVLVIPEGVDVDEKILLHELLHFKYLDTIQNIGWCILRSLHWCNPLVQYAIYRIENNMESLCDQRVLERLEGEERREYGTILLDMANSKYARIPGTSSISNGGKNITRRITSIVHFKKYPQGMTLVSVCIIFVLFCPTIIGNVNTFSRTDYEPETNANPEQLMAIARMNRCTTIAGAVDTYAKGLLLENGVYIASASSLSKHAELEEIMRQNIGDSFRYLSAGTYGAYLNGFINYSVLNLTMLSEDCYTGILAFQVDGYEGTTTEAGYDNTGGYAVLLIPIEIRYEDAWVIKEIAERRLYSGNMVDLELDEYFPYMKMYYGESEVGTVTVRLKSLYRVDNTIRDQLTVLISQEFDYNPKTNAEFNNYDYHSLTEYQCNRSYEKQPLDSVGIITMELDSEEESFVEDSFIFGQLDVNDTGSTSGSSNSGYSWTFEGIDEDWDGKLSDGSGGGGSLDDDYELIEFPAAYAVRIYLDGEVADELVLKEVTE